MVVSDEILCSVLGVIAAVIEEPYYVVGVVELEKVVRVYGRLHRAIFGTLPSDYLWRDGCAVLRRDPSCVIKRGVEDAPLNPLLKGVVREPTPNVG